VTVYAVLKVIHVASAIASIAGFFVRGLWRLSGRCLPSFGWLRWAPHINDTVLLAAAVGLMVVTDQFPVADGWLTAKVLGLLAYIILGKIALSDATGGRLRPWAWLSALLMAGYVVSVAITRNPAGYFATFYAGW
jgi:uncharacterized membrane protein SirB2